MLAVIVLLFAVLWLPYRGYVVYNSVASERYEDLWYLMFCRLMVYANSATNPIIYNIMSSKFRQAFKSIFCNSTTFDDINDRQRAFYRFPKTPRTTGVTCKPHIIADQLTNGDKRVNRDIAINGDKRVNRDRAINGDKRVNEDHVVNDDKRDNEDQATINGDKRVNGNHAINNDKRVNGNRAINGDKRDNGDHLMNDATRDDGDSPVHGNPCAVEDALSIDEFDVVDVCHVAGNV